ncbi:MAG: succinate dehydrogenase [Candidatus Binatia bacterium]
MATAGVSLAPRGFAATTRRDAWWLQPLAVILGFGAFIVYTTWAGIQAEYYHWGPYLSPFYSPELFGESPHAWFGAKPGFWPEWLPYSPAFLILAGPAGFRATCYYYRGAYYKAFWADPPSCTVGEPRKSYWGEASFPLILQNIHRYFLYVALLIIAVLSYDVWVAMWFPDPATGAVSFGIGFGTLVLAANVVLLSAYTLGCHSLRHLVGGRRDLLSRAPLSKKCYGCVGALNRRHMLWAWLSLFSVGFADFYVRMCAMGIWTDPRIF